MEKNNPKKTKDKGIPKLDRFIRPEKQKWYATYSQVASYYSLPYYTAVQLARQANANFHIMKNANSVHYGTCRLFHYNGYLCRMYHGTTARSICVFEWKDYD